jgi:hypothetical protein
VASQLLTRELQRLTEEAQAAPDELAMVIQHCFPHGSMPPGTAEVHLADASEQVVLKLAFARAGRFEAIPEPSLTDEDAQTLIRVINELEGGRTPTVWRVVLFASLPVKGAFRYRDRWQIRPVPEDAPQVPFVMAPHPFVLEAKGSAVSDPFVRWLQGGKLLREAELILSLVLHGGLSPDRSSSPSHEWVVLPGWEYSEDHPSPTSVLAQTSYFMPTMPGPGDDFSDIAGIEPIRLIPGNDYFERRGISVDKTLELPANLAAVVDAVHALPPGDRDRFFRSAYWFSRAGGAWRLSQSLSYICLINSIEVLTPHGVEDRCPTCGLNRAPGPTARFRDFVERYAGDVPDRSRLYQIRSRLVHGDQILQSDQPSGFAFTPHLWEEREQHERARRVAQAAVINWAITHGS